MTDVDHPIFHLDQLLPPSVRERQGDFETPTHTVQGTSTVRRPDAISLDYLIAFAPGPITEGDTSAGLLDRAWRARADNLNNVWLTRTNDTRDGWDPETLLFTYTGSLITEIDLAFDQNARSVICAEIVDAVTGTAVWLYFFDPVAAQFVFKRFDAGRSPRVVLDSPEDIPDSDLLFFYIKSGTPDSLVYRQQRDVYAVILTTPFIDTTDMFIEDVVKASDTRLRVILSQHNLLTGRYTLRTLESTLYPTDTDFESVQLGWNTTGGEIDILLIVYGMDEEGISHAWDTAIGGTLTTPIIFYTMDEEGVRLGWDTTTGGTLLVVVIISGTDAEGVQLGWDTAAGGTLAVVVIVTGTDEEGVQLGWDTRSGGTLA